MNISPPVAIDQIPGTRATRKIVAALAAHTDAQGIVRLTRRKLASLLGLAERTLTFRVAELERYGLIVRYGLNFVFRFARAVGPAVRPEEREDAETEAQALAAFVDGRQRAGATPREAHPEAAPMILRHARRWSLSGSLRGADVMQLARLMGQAYVEDARTQALESNNFPVHPKWIGPALDAVRRSVVLRLQQERATRQALREARAAAPPDPERGTFLEGARALALALIGAPKGAR